MRVVRATAPAPPADALRLDSIRARAASRRKRCSGAGQWGLASAGKGAPGAAERGHGQWPSGRPAEEETEEGKEKGRAGGKKLTCGPRLPERKGRGRARLRLGREWAGTAHAGEKREGEVLGLGEDLGRGKRGKEEEGRG
jgi:hypothetical protein